MSKLLSKQYSAHNGAKHICDHCLNFFCTAHALNEHLLLCKKHKLQRTRFPQQNCPKGFDKLNYISPKSKKKGIFCTEKELLLPFIVFADIETVTTAVNCPPHNANVSGSTLLNTLSPCSAGYKIVSTDPTYYHKPRIFFGPNCIEEFLDALMQEVVHIRHILR